MEACLAGSWLFLPRRAKVEQVCFQRPGLFGPHPPFLSAHPLPTGYTPPRVFDLFQAVAVQWNEEQLCAS